MTCADRAVAGLGQKEYGPLISATSMTKFVEGTVGVGATGPVANGPDMPQAAAATHATSTIVLSEIDLGPVTCEPRCAFA
jgi:hypothetical protein